MWRLTKEFLLLMVCSVIGFSLWVFDCPAVVVIPCCTFGFLSARVKI